MNVNLLDYVPHGAVAALAAIVSWVGKQHISYDKKTRERVETLEADRIVKADVDRIHDRLDALGREFSTAQREILIAIAAKKT